MESTALRRPSPISEVSIGNPEIVFYGDRILQYRGSAKRVKIGPQFSYVDQGAFKTAKNLEELDTGDGVKELAPFALDATLTVKKLIIGPGLKTVHGGALARLPSLEKIEVDPGNRSFKIVDGVLFSSDMSLLLCYPAKRKGDSYEVPAKAESIDIGAFCDCVNLVKVRFPSSLKEIDNAAFANCPSLSDVFLPSSIGYVGKNAFRGCPSLLTLRVAASSLPLNWDPNFAGGSTVQYGAKG